MSNGRTPGAEPLFLDIETRLWFDSPELARLPRALKLAAIRPALAVTWDAEFGRRAWFDTMLVQKLYGWSNDADIAPTLPPELATATRLFEPGLDVLWLELQSYKVITFNGAAFDLPALWHYHRQTILAAPVYWPEWHIDLFDLIVNVTAQEPFDRERWYSLNDLAVANLGRGKLSDGKTAAAWLDSDDPALVVKAFEYCADDVDILRALWGIAQSERGLLLPALPATNRRQAYVGAWRLRLDASGEIVSLTEERNG